MAPMSPVPAARSVSSRMRNFSPAVNVRRLGRFDNSGLAAAGAGTTVGLRPSSVPVPAAACTSATLLGMTTRQFSYALKSKLPGGLCLIIIGREGTMSLKPMEIPPVPEETTRIARAAFPKGTPFLRFRDELGVIYRDEMFAALFPKSGQPATAPWRLALISVFQYVEGLSDRQAAEAVRSRIDWKYSLGLELSDPGFDFSVLCEFRRRLVDGDLGPVLLDALLARLRDQGLLKARGQHRTDATHVLAAIRQINRLENIGETLRAALNAVAAVAPDWLARQVSPEWFERYAVRVEMSRLPKGETERQALAETMGADGHALLAAVYDPAAPIGLRHLPAVQTLRLTWIRQFLIKEGRVFLRQPADTPPASLNGYTPYDTDARFGKKRDITWIGYKAHLSETCDPGEPHVIVNVLTTPAPMTDMEVTALVHQSLASRNLLPTTHFVDAAYVDAGLLTASRADHGIELVGPLLPDTSWQAQAAEGYDLSAFRIRASYELG